MATQLITPVSQSSESRSSASGTIPATTPASEKVALPVITTNGQLMTKDPLLKLQQAKYMAYSNPSKREFFTRESTKDNFSTQTSKVQAFFDGRVRTQTEKINQTNKEIEDKVIEWSIVVSLFFSPFVGALFYGLASLVSLIYTTIDKDIIQSKSTLEILKEQAKTIQDQLNTLMDNQNTIDTFEASIRGLWANEDIESPKVLRQIEALWDKIDKMQIQNSKIQRQLSDMIPTVKGQSEELANDLNALVKNLEKLDQELNGMKGVLPGTVEGRKPNKAVNSDECRQKMLHTAVTGLNKDIGRTQNGEIIFNKRSLGAGIKNAGDRLLDELQRAGLPDDVIYVVLRSAKQDFFANAQEAVKDALIPQLKAKGTLVEGRDYSPEFPGIFKLEIEVQEDKVLIKGERISEISEIVNSVPGRKLVGYTHEQVISVSRTSQEASTVTIRHTPVFDFTQKAAEKPAV